MILPSLLFLFFAFLSAVLAAAIVYVSKKRVGLAVAVALLTLLAFAGLGAALLYLWQSSIPR